MIKLYSYYRSTAAYRVRIALNLKGIEHQLEYVNLLSGEEQQPPYSQVNPQRLVPALEHDGRVLTQSMAILEYLEEIFPATPLMPADPTTRAQIRELGNVIACDIHPLNNLRILKYLGGELGVDEAARQAWYRHWVMDGFSAIEQRLAQTAAEFCFGDSPGLAEVLLVPQVYNAHRFEVDMREFPIINRINQRCLEIDAFIKAAPENQADAA